MTIRCLKCGVESREQGLPQASDGGLFVVRNQICNNGHEFQTFEVHETVWLSARTRHAAAAEAAQRRWSLAERNEAIRADSARGMRGKALAAKWHLTPAAISLILRGD